MSKAQEKSADEISHKEVAEKVTAPKRRYFFPDKNVTVEITPVDDENKNMEKAIKLAEKAENGEVADDESEGSE